MNVGIDIGGSHVGLGVVDNNGKIVKKAGKIINPRIPNYKKVLETFIINTIKDLENEFKIEHIGVGAPGIVKANRIEYCINLNLVNYNLAGILKKNFPNARITVNNDAKCAALAEKNVGALKDYKNAVFLCIGTGIGGAAFYRDKLINPNRCSGFEFGHIIINTDGRNCNCGNRGCFEQYCSLKKLKGTIKRKFNLERNCEGEKLLTFIKSHKKDEDMQNILREYIDNLCIGLSNIVNILEPDVICLGGGFAGYKDVLLKPLEKRFYSAKYLFYKKNPPKIVIAQLENDAGIIGSGLFI